MQPPNISRISRPTTPANAATVMVVGFEPFCVIASDSELVTTEIGTVMDDISVLEVLT